MKDSICWHCYSKLPGWEPQTTQEKLLQQVYSADKEDYFSEPPNEFDYMAAMQDLVMLAPR